MPAVKPSVTRVYKAKLADEFRACGFYDRVPAQAWRKDLVVDIQSVGHGIPTPKYLAPYVYRVAISDKQIVSVGKTTVVHTMRASKANRTVTKTVSGKAFVLGFAQHVLPSGFMKIQQHGRMSAGFKTSLDEVKWLV